MHYSKGLIQAYALQDFTFSALIAVKNSLTNSDGSLSLSKEDAATIVALQKAWQGCQERIAFHRRVPSPGALRPTKESKRKAISLLNTAPAPADANCLPSSVSKAA
jgi:hypothetical protein